ncbi:unnamed protein product, partial [Choristocarpus tenellus]
MAPASALPQYDIVELRALVACLPERFEVDRDGRKAAWRASFMQRVQGMVSQERGDTVLGGWDPVASRRRSVRLPSLTSEQERKPVYFYATPNEMQAKVDKMLERQQRVDVKRVKLREVEDVLLPEARQEYADVLEDTRHPANKEAFSVEELRRAREEARAAMDSLAREAKRLRAEVATGERMLTDGPYTIQSLKDEQIAMKDLFETKARAKAEAEKEAGEVQQAEDVLDDKLDEGDMKRGLEATTKEGDVQLNGEENKEKAHLEEREEGPIAQENYLSAVPVEVMGPFDMEPVLTSRLADRESSLKFVTAEEDARQRREELERAIGARGNVDVARAKLHQGGEEACIGNAKLPGTPSLEGVDNAELGILSPSDSGLSPRVGWASRSPASVDPITPRGNHSRRSEALEIEEAGPRLRGGNGRMKELSAMLEKSLGQKIGQRAPTPGSAVSPLMGASIARAARDSPFSPRSTVGASGGRKKTSSPVPPCQPKSKFFRSMTAQAASPGVGAVASVQGRPQPPALGGLLAQIREGGKG